MSYIINSYFEFFLNQKPPWTKHQLTVAQLLDNVHL